jgi:hypothetical protein
LQSCLEDLVEFGDTLPSGEKIACIFDENKLVAGKKPECLGAAVNHYSDLKNARGWDRLAGIIFENKREFVPLQAADMLAMKVIRIQSTFCMAHLVHAESYLLI